MKKHIKVYVPLLLIAILFIFALLFYTSLTLQSKFDKSKLKGKILFQREKSYYLMNANGMNIRSINIIRYPVLSLQAKKIAWIVYKDSKMFNEKKEAILIMDVDGENSKIFGINVDNGPVRQVEAGDRPPVLWGVCWSKSGEEVTLYYKERFRKDSRSYKIAMNVINGDCRIIKELSQEHDSDYDDYWHVDIDSPDGTKAFAESDASFNIGIEGYLIDKLSGKKTYIGIPFHYSYISWSPDSNKLVYARHGDIYIVNADGTNLRRLTNYKYPWYADPMSGRGGYEEPSWASDSSYIYCTYIERIGISIFSSPSFEIHVIDAITGSNIFLTKGRYPMWLPEEFNIPDIILSSGMLGR